MHAPPPLRFVEAPLFPDLHEALVTALVEASRRDPLMPRIVVTPNPRMASHLVRAAQRRGAGPLHLQTLTFPDLASRLSAASRWRRSRPLLPDPGAAVVARRALAPGKRPPGFFAQALDLRGFRTAMMHCFDELAAAGLARAEAMERFIVDHGEVLSRRARHTLELALGYRRELEARHDDSWSLLRQAAEVELPQAAQALGTQELWIHGVERLSALERRLVQHLAGSFALQVHCVSPASGTSGLSAWLRGLGFVALDPPPAAPVPRQVRVRSLSSPGEEAEAREIARHVLQAAAEGVPFHDMAVVTRNVTSLPLIEETLTHLGVPCLAPSLFSLATRRAGRALLLWLELAESGLSPSGAVEFLLLVPARWSDWCGIDADPVPSAWERAAREARLGTGLDDWRVKLQRGNEAWRQRLQRDADGASRAATAAAAARTELLRVAEVLHQELRSVPARARWSEHVAVTADFVARVFQEDDETRLLRTALGRLRALDGLAGPRPRRAEFRDALRQLLGRVRVPAPASHSQGVSLGTAEELRGCDFEWMCLAGLQEGEWPGPVPEDPVLPDRERAQLNRLLQDAEALPLRRHLVERQRTLFQALVSAARGQVVLSFARLDPATAAARLPSSLLLEFAEQREGRRLDYAAFAALPWCERVPLRRRDVPGCGPVLSLEEFDALTVASFPRPAARRYVRKLGVAAARGLAMETLRNGRPRFTAFDGLLSGREARDSLARFLEGRAFSASQLATYATCPFRYCMRHLLRVEPQDRAERREPTLLEVGLLVHRILESFYVDAAAADVDLSTADFAVLRQRLMQAAGRQFESVEALGQQGARLLWEIRKQSLRQDLGRFLRQEVQRLRAGSGWIPAQFEFRFGPQEGGSPVVSYGASSIRFRGVIDRIDHHRQHDGVCVVDYKSGRVLAPKRNPQALQLVLYLLATCRGDPERLGRSEARFLYVTRRGGFVMQRLAGARLAVRRQDFDTLVRGVRAGIEAGELFAQPGPHAVHCSVCDYRGLCDARIARQVQSKGGGHQDARWRQLPDFGADLEPLEAQDD